MAKNLTKQTLQLHTTNLVEINDVLRRIELELNRLAGLSGSIAIYDSLQYHDSNDQVLHGVGVKPS